jgi:hypothetical protein
MDVGVHSSVSSATKADAVPMSARAVSSCGTGWPPPVVAAWIASSWARCTSSPAKRCAGVSASGWMRCRTVMPVSSRRASVSVTSSAIPTPDHREKEKQMGKIALSQNTSLDGVMQSPGPEDVPFNYRAGPWTSTAVPRVPDSTRRKRLGSSRRRTPRPSCSDGSPTRPCRPSGPQRKVCSPTG